MTQSSDQLTVPPRLPDFDTLRRLAETDPGALAALRDRLVNAVIDNAAPTRRRRLRGLQFEIEARIAAAANPMAATVTVAGMMRRSLERLAASYQAARDDPTRQWQPASAPSDHQPDNVVPFRPRLDPRA